MTDQDITIAMAEVEGIAGPLQKRWLKEYDREGNDVWAETGFGADGELVPLPSYLTDANACLRVLEREARWETNFIRDDEWGARSYCVEVRGFKVLAPTFCRAACEAVLRAYGKWREA